MSNNFGSAATFIATYSDGTATSFYIANATNGYLAFSSVSGSFPVACVRLDSTIRFTRAPQSTANSIAALDAACVSEYGTNYQLADSRDLQALWRNNMSNNFGSAATFIATYGDGAAMSFYIANATNGYLALSGVSGSFPVACVRLNG